MVSPQETRTEPDACLARRPVSSPICFPETVHEEHCTIISAILLLKSRVEEWRSIIVEGSVLFSYTQIAYQNLVSFHVLRFEIVQEAPSLAHQFQQTPPGVVIFLVYLEVFRQVTDSFGQEGHLDFGRAGVRVVTPIPFDD